MKRSAVAAAAVLLVLAVGVTWRAQVDDPSGDSRAARARTAAGPSAAVSPSPTETPPTTCATVSHPFAPRVVAVPGITKGAVVVTPPRERDGTPGAPPLTERGKTLFAWDRAQGTRPGDAAGNVLLNAHTWPDGTALGNRLLAGLQPGDPIVVRGTRGRLCYRVTERVEVLASDGLPRYYATDGPPQLAIVVCSGRRLGPGEWEKRTVWFAAPSV